MAENRDAHTPKKDEEKKGLDDIFNNPSIHRFISRLIDEDANKRSCRIFKTFIALYNFIRAKKVNSKLS